jgi:hypothetical protein
MRRAADGFSRQRLANPLEREKRSFKAFLEFLKENPEFYRILCEAPFAQGIAKS